MNTKDIIKPAEGILKPNREPIRLGQEPSAYMMGGLVNANGHVRSLPQALSAPLDIGYVIVAP